MGRVLRARERVGGRERPTAPATPASASVRVPSVSAGTVESGASTIQRPRVSSPCSATSRASSGSCSKPRRKPVAQITCSAPFTDGSTRNRPSRGRARERLVPARARAGTTARAASRSSAARSSGAEPVEAARARGARSTARGTFSGRRSGSRRRTETTSAPAASAFSHSVAAASPAPTTRHARRVLVRLVGVDGARVVARARPGTCSPGWPGASSTCRNDPVAVELEAAVDRAHALDPRAARRSRPSRSARAAPRRASRKSSTVGW